ncbi:MAG: hypothetical protein ACTSR3_19025 [Candidatus Helarchaeota archaeon]
MARNLDNTFREEKNKLQSGALINLYEFDLSGTPYRVAEYDQDVTFDGNVYSALPIKSGVISENKEGKIAEFEISIGDPSRAFGGYLELYDGLVGSEVKVTKVFSNHLNDPTAKIEETFYVRNARSNAFEVSLTLAPKYDIIHFTIPRRVFSKNYCQWNYKGVGCWLEITGGYTAAPGFIDTDYCDHSLDGPSGCEFHQNEERFGGFYGIPSEGYLIRI